MAEAAAHHPPTRPILLARLRDPADAAAWREFVDLYAPLVYGFCRRRGLQDADAADLTQDVLRAVAGAAPGFAYDPKKGRFRGWLFTIVRNQLHNFRAKAAKPGRGSGDSGHQEMLQAQPDPDGDLDQIWDREYEQHLFQWAAAQVKKEVQPSTWEAFERTAKGEGGQDVAQALGMSVAAVYLAKSRVLTRIKKLIEPLLEE